MAAPADIALVIRAARGAPPVIKEALEQQFLPRLERHEELSDSDWNFVRHLLQSAWAHELACSQAKHWPEPGFAFLWKRQPLGGFEFTSPEIGELTHEFDVAGNA